MNREDTRIKEDDSSRINKIKILLKNNDRIILCKLFFFNDIKCEIL